MKTRARGPKKEPTEEIENVSEKMALVRSDIDLVIGRLEDVFTPDNVLFRDEEIEKISKHIIESLGK